MDHRPAKGFGVGFASPMSEGDVMARAVVLHDHRVVHRKIGRALLEIADRIAAGTHDGAKQFVGARNRLLRVVDEIRLYSAPRRRVTGAFPRRERMERWELWLTA